MKRSVMVFLVVINLFITGCRAKGHPSGNIVPNEKFNSIKKTVSDKIKKGDIPSISIALAENGKITWMESFGWSDKENKIKATPNTLYSIASISKPLTATGIMKLHQQGKVRLDEDIQTYMKTLNIKHYYEGKRTKITCRNLLNHTSGLPMHFRYYYDDEKYVIPTLGEVIAKYGFLVSPPSSRYNYSNLGYGILGQIISNLSGKDFTTYMTEEIFLPLGMVDTTFDFSSRTKAKLAKRYGFDGKLLPYSFADTPGAANASTTVKDLIHFGMFHLDNNFRNLFPVLSKTTIQLMQQKQYPDNSNNRNSCGLGWFINEKDYKYKVVYHAGGMDGVDCILTLVPSKNIAVVVLVNQSTINARFTEQITDRILTKLIPDLKNVKKNKPTGKDKDPDAFGKKDFMGKWVGHIKTNKKSIPISLIFQEDGDIHVHTQAQFKTVLLSSTPLKSFQYKMLLNKWLFNNVRLMGWYAEKIPCDDLKRCSHVTLLDIEYRSGKLIGIAAALANSDRMYYGISHYLELVKSK